MSFFNDDFPQAEDIFQLDSFPTSFSFEDTTQQQSDHVQEECSHSEGQITSTPKTDFKIEEIQYSPHNYSPTFDGDHNRVMLAAPPSHADSSRDRKLKIQGLFSQLTSMKEEMWDLQRKSELILQVRREAMLNDVRTTNE